ncbi:DUF3221 domain-containing protein [Pontibacillus yanchengensis]|uniref:DUF3221 domain-containing protein n=2 Tax=Pontibacillus yanchengensis TaxID=462910 RepID=A0ACC7VCR5_9BACI|nr:DUF3221 domain-containing protein [Pontibacillus yanchengensis]MYL32183.1 DUF3221 domain-containing protein [Pontibacillus yanchengensis]MYL52763.1 DUF3221 domain-containing protein [Pontibacillus yanchengensis]
MKRLHVLMMGAMLIGCTDNSEELSRKTKIAEVKGTVAYVETKEVYQRVLVIPDIEKEILETANYDESLRIARENDGSWFTIENQNQYKVGQSVRVRYDQNQIHTETNPPGLGADKIKIIQN